MKFFQYNYILILILIFLFSLESCKSPTAPNNKNLTLTISDVSCTEAWITLSSNNVPLPANILIKKNGNEFLNINLVNKDTALYDSSLLPNQTYSYQAVYNNGFNLGMSEVVSAKTMDTTSNNYSWQLYTLGNALGASSTLYDVAIINDTSIWAVGEINIQDSIGMFNAVHWDGKNWNLKRIEYYTVCGQTNRTPYPARSILAYNENEIWIAVYGDQIAEIENGIQTKTMCVPWSFVINKIWGMNTNEFYLVGNSGNIIHYQTGNWQKIESGTTQDLYDIYSNDGQTIYASGGNFQNYNGILLRGNNNGFQTLEEGENIGDPNLLFHPYFDGIAKTVWSSNTGSLYFGGNELYIYKNGTISEDKTLAGNSEGENVNGEYFGFISQIRGTAVNDILLVGERNTIRHFNGVRWQQLGMPYDQSSDFTWLSISMKNGLAVVVGYTRSNAIIMVLKK